MLVNGLVDVVESSQEFHILSSSSEKSPYVHQLLYVHDCYR